MLTFLTSWLSPFFNQITTHSQGLTTVAALMAAIFGPIAAVYIGRRQVNATVRSTNRVAWITALREDICEIMEKRVEVADLIHSLPESEGPIFYDPKKGNELLERIRFLTYRIELRLYREDPLHASLIGLLQQAPAPPINAKLNADIKTATQDILRKEWKKAAKAK
jgi:hypothetical protein